MELKEVKISLKVSQKVFLKQKTVTMICQVQKPYERFWGFYFIGQLLKDELAILFTYSFDMHPSVAIVVAKFDPSSHLNLVKSLCCLYVSL